MTSQIALSLLLVIAAFVFVRTFQKLVSLNLGFQQDHVLVADFDAGPLQLPTERRAGFARKLLGQVKALPGVLSAGETGIVPLSGNGWNDFIDVQGTAIQRKLSNFSEVSSGYFQTLEVPIFAGRNFTDTDTQNAPLVAIVNEAFAQQYLADRNPVDKVFGVRQEWKTRQTLPSGRRGGKHEIRRCSGRIRAGCIFVCEPGSHARPRYDDLNPIERGRYLTDLITEGPRRSN